MGCVEVLRSRRLWALGVVLVAGAGCSSARTAGSVGDAGAQPGATPAGPREEAALAPAFVPRLLQIGAKYGYRYNRLTAAASWAPWQCWLPPKVQALADPGTASGPHGRKLYFLYTFDEPAYRKGGTQPVGQTVVKEAWHPRLQAPGEKPEGMVITAQLDGKTYVPGRKGPLFVMTKLAPQTPNTDEGWVYATLSPKGDTVTSAGRIGSCMGCHEKGTQDRLFRPLPAETPPGGS